MAEVQYTKTAVMKTTEGDVTLTQGDARALQKQLDDSHRFFKRLDPDTGVLTYYDIFSAACGFCKVLTITPGTKASAEIPCEDGLPDCPAADDPGTIVVDGPVADGGEATE